MRLTGLLMMPLAMMVAGTSAAAQGRTVEWQIAAAVLPLPDSMRAGAEVLGYRTPGGPLVQLRAGTNPMICLADDPAVEGYAAHCYHASLAAFMERGRALRAAGITKRSAVDSARLAEIKAGTLSITAAKPQKGAECEPINFDPLVMADGIAPTKDPILQFRSSAYAVSFGKRLSGQ